MTQEAANVEADKPAGWAWEEEYNAVKPQPVASHYRHSTALQTILPDGCISGNLAQNIPEAIMTFRGKTTEANFEDDRGSNGMID